MKVIELLFKHFEDFIKRALFPSVSFVFIFLLIGILTISVYQPTEFTFEMPFTKINIDSSIWWILFILLIGFSFFLSILHQVFYDNLLKNNFNSCCDKVSNDVLIRYRLRVKQKLTREEIEIFGQDHNSLSDNLLYQIVGRKLLYFKEKTNTNRYVNDTKSIGIFFISLIISILFWSYLCQTNDNNSIIIGAIISLIVWFIGFNIIKAKYRSRAIRMYVNYLLGEPKKAKDETKKCTTFICKEETKPS